MMAKGRKRKTGTRTKSGQLSRAGQPRHDKGNDRIAAMRERFGEHYASPIGRAFAAGLLGDGMEAMDRYQEGKRFARIHGRLIAKPYRCPLDASPRGLGGEVNQDRDQREQDWFFLMASKLDKAGLRPWLDQMISPVYTDGGPYWLDALLNGGKHPADMAVLRCAINALDCIVPSRKVIGILAAA